MSPANDAGPPVVETAPGEDHPDITLRSLRLRIRQQEILAELGVIALQGASFDKLLEETARLTAEGLRAEFCKVLEHIPSKDRLLRDHAQLGQNLLLADAQPQGAQGDIRMVLAGGSLDHRRARIIR